MAELHHLSEHCAFDISLDDMLRDRVVCGVCDTRVQRRLLVELNLTFKKAFEICQSAEVAEKNARELQMSQKYKVHLLLGYHQSSHSKEPATPLPCYRCGGKQHSAQDCRFKTAECHHCRKKGHIAKVCRSKHQRGQHQQGPGSSATAKPGRTHHVDEVSSQAEVEDSPYSLYHVSAGTAAAICVTVKVNGANLRMEVDTGASLSLISEATYRNLWQSNRPQLQPTEKVLSTYTGESLEVLGSLSVLVEYGEQKSQLELPVISGSRPSMLGCDWLLAIKLDWSQLHHMTVPSTLHKVLQKHTIVFKDELGEVKGTTAKIHVDPQARPRFCKPCTVPYAEKWSRS